MVNEKEREERRRPRVSFETRITMTVDGESIRVKGSSRDLSMKGAFVFTDRKIAVGRKCELSIELTGTVDNFALGIEGHVARQESSGVAVIFDSMDVDTYTHLKNVVRYNFDNPDAV